ncbi:MAG: signal peptidase I [Treponema sp.]|jgi:signal peptidase I|nr:signal peptidase I [Treponema sp.]
MFIDGRKKAVLSAIAVALVLKIFFFDFIIAQGNSMEPAIHNGTVLVVSKLRYGLRLPWLQKYLIRWALPKTGEVVVFYTPTGELAVKRCVSLNEWGRFYAEGDNRNSSYDSRSYGPVSADNIIGKVLGY